MNEQSKLSISYRAIHTNIDIDSRTRQRRNSEISRRTICGVIESLSEHHVLDPNDLVVVTLCDITLLDWTRIDCPHIPRRFIVSNIELHNCDHFPIPFTLYYNADEIDENLCYGIRCDIFDKDQQVKYNSERFIDVLTDKYPKTNITITVVPCRIASTTKTNDETDKNN